MEEITVESLTLKELFDKQQTLTIPEYQRPYVWTPKEINKLLAQIKQHQDRIDEKPLFYLGSIVLHKKGETLEVIDGQQRLTTVQILSLINSGNDFGIKYSHPISLKNIKSNHNHFSKISFKNIEFDKINVTIVVVESEDLAYSFFETLNTGGKRLSGTDILKAHHLRSITKIAERNKYAYNWEEKQKNLEAVNKLLVKARRIDYLKLKNIPDKFASSENWKNVLTEDFAENVGKEKLDIGYSLVEIEENTHRIISDKYSIRQPLNEGKNYINYLMSFSNAYNAIFETNNREDFYSKFNNKMIDQIDGTVDLRSFYQLCLLCFVDMFGKNNLLEFSLWLFRHIFSLRLNEQSRIYEPTVRNYIDNTKIIERIFHAYSYQEIITYFKEYKTPEIKINGSQVKQRFFDKCCEFFPLDNPSEGNFDEKLKEKIEELVKSIKMKFETYIKTVEEIVDDNYEFIIPVYQRPYVWDDEEIKKLLEDIKNTFTNSNESSYFVGNTYVIKSSNQQREKQYELIDGQQRFTTFWLIANAFKLLNIKTEMTNYLEITYPNMSNDIRFDFDIRIEVAHYLKGLLDNSSYLKFSDVSDKEFLKFIAKGVETIKHFITSEIKEEQRPDFGNYIYRNVRFVFNVAPKNTDLNALFTALGTSGIQLQQTDILKARLLEKVGKTSRIKYSKIWEACEKMSNYFEKNVADVFNIERTKIKPENFKFYDTTFFPVNVNSNSSENNHQAKTISEIINSDEVDVRTDTTNADNSSKCRSLISFNILLIHTYRIFNLQKQLTNFDHSIDPKTLLSTIKLDTFSTLEETESFFELLWKVRYTFDKHVVKWRMEEDDDNDEKLLLTSITTDGYRTNLSYSSSQMLQSVLYFTGGFTQQYWLTPFLWFLLQNENVTNEQILLELEKIDNLMLPGDKKEISLKLITQEKRNDKIDLNALSILTEPHGTSFHHYWFYKLEYLLWKTWDKNDSKIKQFRITSKNSVEHVFPQNHEFGNKLDNTETDWLNSFGNLGLLSVGENSSYNNQSVIKKKNDFDNKHTYDSLKLAKVYSSPGINSWGIENIKKHQDEMIKTLQDHYKQ